MSRSWEDVVQTEAASNCELGLPLADRQREAMGVTSSSSQGSLLAAVTLFEVTADAESENAESLILNKYRDEHLETPG